MFFMEALLPLKARPIAFIREASMGKIPNYSIKLHTYFIYYFGVMHLVDINSMQDSRSIIGQSFNISHDIEFI